MDIVTLGGIKVSRLDPEISIRIVNNQDDISAGLLYIRRIGDNFDSIVYEPSSVSEDALKFNFDELLFSMPFGKYSARLMVGTTQRTAFYIRYIDVEQIEVT